jgi:hypothetical protein
MGASEGIIVLVVTLLLTGGLFVGMFLFMALVLFLPPRLTNKKIARWTEGSTCFEAWEAIEKGATRGGFQIRPASFLYEVDKVTPYPPEQALSVVAQAFSSGWGRKVLMCEPNAVVVQMRFFPWAAVDFGWVGVAWAFPNGPGSTMKFRFRTTYMWPVITFFLSLRLKMWVLDRLL